MLKQAQRNILFILVVAAIGLTIYAPSIHSYFLTDDFNTFRLMHINRLMPINFFQHFGFRFFYRPVFAVMLWLEFLFFRLNYAPYILVNIILHIINTVLVYFLVNAVTAKKNPSIGFWAAIIFLVHPVQVNTVCWVSSGATLWSAMFLIGSILAYIDFRRSGKLSSCLCFIILWLLALFTYEASVVLPALIIIYEVILYSFKDKRACSFIRENRWAILLSLILLLEVYFTIRIIVIGKPVGGYFDFTQRIQNTTFISVVSDMLINLRRILNPAFDEGAVSKARLFGYIVFIPVVVAGIFKSVTSAMHRRQILFWLAWTVILFAPFVFAPIVPTNSRYAYLPSIGVCSLIVFSCIGTSQIFKKQHQLVVRLTLLGLFTIVYFMLSQYYVNIYKDIGRWIRFMQVSISRRYEHNFNNRDTIIVTPDYPRTTYYYPDLHYMYENISGVVFGPPFFQEQMNIYYAPQIGRGTFDLLSRGAGDKLFIGVNRDYEINDYAAADAKQQRGIQRLVPAVDIIYPNEGATLDDDSDWIIVKPAMRYDSLRFIFLNINTPVSFKVKYSPGTIAVDLSNKSVADYLKFFTRNKVYWWCFAVDRSERIVGYSGLRSFWIDYEK